MIDLHCHILPGIDDGPPDVERSLKMAACALKDGTHTLVATPHSRNGLFHNSLAHVLVQVTQFKKILGENQILFQLSLDGITPVLAYPERNTALQRNPGILSELVSMGCLVQLTAMSITGELGRDAMEYSHFLLQHRQAHVLASDAHDADSRPPVLSRAVEAAAHLLNDTQAAAAMVTDNPRAILEGRPLNPPEPGRTYKKQSWWKRMIFYKGNTRKEQGAKPSRQ